MIDGRARTDRNTLRAVIILTGTFLFLSVVSVYTFYDLNGGSFDIEGREPRLIVTDSMDGGMEPYDIPTIRKDSLVMVSYLSEDGKTGLKEGDVIQFTWNGVLNHHRVVSNDSENGVVVTKGDNSDSVETVAYSDIKGIVVGENHILGVAFKFTREYIFAIVAFIVVVYTGFRLVEEIRLARKGENSDEER